MDPRGVQGVSVVTIFYQLVIPRTMGRAKFIPGLPPDTQLIFSKGKIPPLVSER